MRKQVFRIVSNEEVCCPDCGTKLKKKGWVPRSKKLSGGEKVWRLIEIRQCTAENCGHKHRLLPDDNVPYKHYESKIIEKTIDDDFTEEELLEIEDYPCEATICRWRIWAIQFLKNAEGKLRSVLHDTFELSDRFLAVTDSLLEEIKRRIQQGWLAVILQIIVNLGGIGDISNIT